MTIFQALILGLIQGLTEFIPVSSSGHLIIIPEIFDWEEHSTAFDIVLHMGTLFSLIWYFWKDATKGLKMVTKSSANQKENRQKFFKIFFQIVIATLPALIIGALFNDFIDEKFKDVKIAILMLIFIGIIMIISDFVFKKNNRTFGKLKFLSFLIIGLFQSLAFIRGTSRSGITIIGGLTQKLKREEAARLSFILAIPITAAAVGYQIIDFSLNGLEEESIAALIVGFLTAALSGFFAIKFMISFLSNRGLTIFGIYRIILGILLILFVL